DKDTFQRIPVPLLLEFLEANFQFAFEQFNGAIRTASEYFRYTKELRFVVFNHARRRRERNLAIRENEELLRDLLMIGALGQVDENLYLIGSVIIDVFDLQF